MSLLSFVLRRNVRITTQISKNLLRAFHDEFSSKKPPSENEKNPNQSLGTLQQKYKVFRDEDSAVIFDVEEEKLLQSPHQESSLGEDSVINKYAGLNLERGISAVFEIEDLVAVLRRENAENLFVCVVPKELKYVDYMVVVTGRSYRHMMALVELVRRVYKIKSRSGERLPKIEGENSREWKALDLGNIALHVFSVKARTYYDLESLWSIGSEYDDECNKPNEPLIEMFEKHTLPLRDFKNSKSIQPDNNQDSI